MAQTETACKTDFPFLDVAPCPRCAALRHALHQLVQAVEGYSLALLRGTLGQIERAGALLARAQQRAREVVEHADVCNWH